jgi:5S rRNA maturation endonuclease (ribonuclease M5)
MSTTWVSFKQIKADVGIEQILAHYGVALRRIGTADLRGRCPLPTHTSPRSRDSFAVSIARNVWSCRSQSCMQARGGRPGGNILDLVVLMEGCSLREAALRLQAWSGAAPDRYGAPREAPHRPPVVENAPLRFTLQYVNSGHPYLAARGLRSQTARSFGIGLYGGHGLLRGRIVIPIHNASGELIAYAGRAIDGQEPKYRFPAGFRKSLVLFNLHRALKTGAHTVIVVEGFLDALAVHQAGCPTVVALMGSALSRHQADLLCAHFDRVLVMLDGDEAGRRGAAIIADTLSPRVRVALIPLDAGTQPDQLRPAAIQHLLGGRVHGS